MATVNLPSGCVGCHKLGTGYSTCSGCGLRFCPSCTAKFGRKCTNCGSRLI